MGPVLDTVFRLRPSMAKEVLREHRGAFPRGSGHCGCRSRHSGWNSDSCPRVSSAAEREVLPPRHLLIFVNEYEATDPPHVRGDPWH